MRLINPVRRSRALKLSALILILLFGIVFTLSESSKAQSKSPRSIAYYSQLLAEIALSVRDQYVEEINVDALFEAAVEGMLEGLDPYTIALTKQNIGLVEETAKGKYEGIGIDIDIRNGAVTIITPLEGSPAERLGLRAGDQIVAIDDTPVSGLKPHQINQMLRGKAGTSVKLSILHPGTDTPEDYDVERAVIEVHPVPYWGMVNNDVGYIRLASFTEQTSDEFEHAINDLKNKGGMKSLIVDLRSNGGGLLGQAIGVVSQFLPKDKLVVFTKGRSAKRVRKYFSNGSSLFTSGRMVVLVDSGTASAAEITTGALQDWDRAVIMGQQTYGKGLVQNIFQWPEHEIALKLTTSRYYIPSGRLIQRSIRLKKRGVNLEAASRVIENEELPDTTTIYKTDDGRKVKGGGGISPDIVLHVEAPSELVSQLNRENLFFRFALEYNQKHPSVSRDITVGDKILDEFRQYIKQQGFEYKTHLESALDRVEQLAKTEKVESALDSKISDLRQSMENLSKSAFDNAKDVIALEIKKEILRSKFNQDAVYEDVILKNDKEVKAAVELLSDKGKYQDLLKP